jgi:hypothetical protein
MLRKWANLVALEASHALQISDERENDKREKIKKANDSESR